MLRTFALGSCPIASTQLNPEMFCSAIVDLSLKSQDLRIRERASCTEKGLSIKTRYSIETNREGTKGCPAFESNPMTWMQGTTLHICQYESSIQINFIMIHVVAIIFALRIDQLEDCFGCLIPDGLQCLKVALSQGVNRRPSTLALPQQSPSRSSQRHCPYEPFHR